MLTLVLDFATRRQKIGVFRGRDVAEASFLPGRGSAAAPVTLLTRTLAMVGGRADQVSRIILNRGPGSFTGIRVAFSLAAGLRLASGARVCGLLYPDALVQTAARRLGPDWNGRAVCLLHALRGEVYARRYCVEDGAPPRAEGDVELRPLAELPSLTDGVSLVLVDEAIPVNRQPHWQDTCLSPAALYEAAGELLPPDQGLPRPFYLRRSWARERKDG